MTLGTFSASSVRRAPVRCGPPCPPALRRGRVALSLAPAHAPQSAVAVLPERIRRSEKRRRDRMRNAPALTSSSSRSIFSAQPTRPRPSAAAGRCSSQADAGASARGEGVRGEGARGEGARGDQGERRGAVHAAPRRHRRELARAKGRSPAEARGDRVSPDVLSFYVRGDAAELVLCTCRF